MAKVLKLDVAHDIALLGAPGAPPHDVVHFAPTIPQPGEELHFIGHDRGLYWTYMRGVMARSWSELRGMPNKLGPWMQVTAPVSGGMSGSGAFDGAGRLVGLCSSIAAQASSVAFYVPRDTLVRFIDKS